ncbi:MAG: I78 family peptidase inhibitor [Albidovulum sp.]
MQKAAILALILGTAGCVPTQPADTCGAERLSYIVGQNAAAAYQLPQGLPVRILYPATPRSEDYSPSRINIEIGADGIITSVWCG